ncbi:MAG: 3'-5' exonuclease [Candidatus ainarchaeum sp.]|nr:3'-5' exonuclease [Candidatus ainarchaeum sp.]
MLEKYTVIDLETTGLSPQKDKITEIAAIKVKNNKIIDKFECLVNPEIPIPVQITEITGITDSMVYRQKTIDKVLPDLNNFLKDSIIVGHNINFDYSFLKNNLNKYLNLEIDNKTLCTYKLAKKIFPKIVSCRLNSLCNYFNIENKNAHRAMSDVLATNNLFLKFQAIMHNNGIQDEIQILDFFLSNKKLDLSFSTFD